MKRLILYLFTLIAPLSVLHASNESWIMLELEGGVHNAFLVSGGARISIEADSIRLKSKFTEVAFSRSKVRGWYFFSKFYLMDIEESQEAAPSVEYDGGDELIIRNLDSDKKVAVYGVNGIAYNSRAERTGSDVRISLRSLPHGTYIVSVAGMKSFRILH